MSAKGRSEAGRKVPASRKKQAASKRKKSFSAPRSAVVVTRDASGRFQKGSSGNPAGSKVIVPEEVRALARNLSIEGILRLAHWMRSGDAMASIAATKIILDRGLGKSIQPLGLPNGGALVNLNIGAAPVRTAEELQAVYSALMRDPSLDLSALKIELQPAREPIEHAPKGSVAGAEISAPMPLPEET